MEFIFRMENLEWKMENLVIYDLLVTIYYFPVAQTTVLIGVNPCLTENDLKKQTQF